MIRRLSVAVAAAVLTATVASGCSTFTNNDEAAKAGGASLSVDEFEMILADYADSRSAGAATSTTAVGDTTTTDPTVPGEEARSLLTEWVTSHLLIAALNKAGAPIDDAARTAATTSLQTDIGAGWDQLDEVTKEFLIEDQAATDALAESPLISDSEVQEAYEAGIISSNTLCLRVIAFTDQTTANDVYEQLRDGGDFATLADANATDPTAGQGGIFTNSNTGSECSAASQLNDTIAQAVALLPLGQATEPIAFANSDGSSQYVIFLQRPWDEVAAAASPIVRESLAPGTAKALIAAGSAHVDSRYGTWDPTTLSVVPDALMATQNGVAAGRVIVVGLGPGGHEHVTQQTLTAIAECPHRYLRTSRHPSADLVPDAIAFDHFYETSDTFGSVYERVTEALVAAAAEHGEVLFAVPGSPLMLERSVRHLRADPRVECVVLPALSFLDASYAALGIDPIEAAVTLVDGHEFAAAAAGKSGPLLVSHCHANWVLSDIKLAVDDASDVSNDDLEVVILQRLGTPDELITHTTWSQMDTAVEADHLTTLYIPRLRLGVAEHYQRFHALARTLREQCPWDIEQTHASLIPYLLEETYEVVDALQALDPDDERTDADLIEELGDLLYQIEFHATIAEQQGRFTIADITQGVHDKLVRRHPHVFADTEVDGTEQVLSNWETIKRDEKNRTSIFDGIPSALPSLSYAYKSQKKAAALGFDWPDVSGALPKIAEEVDELMQAHSTGDESATADELGDLLFSVVNVARHLKVDPEVALRAAVTKFRTRFEGVERLAAERGIDLAASDLVVLDQLWDEVKGK